VTICGNAITHERDRSVLGRFEDFRTTGIGLLLSSVPREVDSSAGSAPSTLEVVGSMPDLTLDETSLMTIRAASPEWQTFREAFADGGGRWYAFLPRLGYTGDKPLVANSVAELIAAIWEAESRSGEIEVGSDLRHGRRQR